MIVYVINDDYWWFMIYVMNDQWWLMMINDGLWD